MRKPVFNLRTKSFDFTCFKSFSLTDVFCFYSYLECVFVSNEAREELDKRGERSLTSVGLHLPAGLNFGRKINH